MRPKLKEESTEIDKMSVHMLNYYQDAEAHFDELEENGEFIAKSLLKKVEQIKELKADIKMLLTKPTNSIGYDIAARDIKTRHDIKHM